MPMFLMVLTSAPGFDGSVRVVRYAEARNSIGVFTLLRKYFFELNSGLATSVRRTDLMSPPDARKVLAMRSTSAGGGSSATKRCAIFQLMKCAVRSEEHTSELQSL